jgi:hypothetical protein
MGNEGAVTPIFAEVSLYQIGTEPSGGSGL